MYIPIWLIFIIVAAGIFWFIDKRRAVANKHLPFRPYFIRIVPNWYLLLKDYGIIKDELQCNRTPSGGEGLGF